MSKQFLQIVLIAQTILSCLAVMSVNVHPKQEVCFAFKTPGEEAARISGNFDVYDDELSMDPITVVLFDYESEKVIWHSKKGSSEGSFALINVGKFHICFGNGSAAYDANNGESKKTKDKMVDKLVKMKAHPKPNDDDFTYENNDGYDRRIGFAIRVEPLEGTRMNAFQKEKTQSGEDLATQQSMKLSDLTYQLVDKMEMLLDHQEYIKGRESFHRHVVEQTFTMVMRWTIFEAMILIFIAVVQVIYLMRFFETKRYL